MLNWRSRAAIGGDRNARFISASVNTNRTPLARVVLDSGLAAFYQYRSGLFPIPELLFSLLVSARLLAPQFLPVLLFLAVACEWERYLLAFAVLLPDLLGP